MINMLRDLMEKEKNMQVHIENMSREMEILRKTKKSIITDQKLCNKNEKCVEMDSVVDWHS